MKAERKQLHHRHAASLLLILLVAAPMHHLLGQAAPVSNYPDHEGVYVLDGTNCTPIYMNFMGRTQEEQEKRRTFPGSISILVYLNLLSGSGVSADAVKIRDWKFIDDKAKTEVPAAVTLVSGRKNMLILAPKKPLAPGLYSITVGDGPEYLFGVETPNEIDFWTEMVKEHPDSWQSYNHLGALIYMAGKPLDAEPYFAKAVELNPQNPESHNNLGLALSYKGDKDGAIVQYQAAVKLRDDAVMNVNLANAYSAVKRYDDAIRTYRHSIELNPRIAAAHCNLGYALMQEGKIDEAIPEFLETKELDPNIPQSNSYLEQAMKLQQQGNPSPSPSK